MDRLARRGKRTIPGISLGIAFMLLVAAATPSDAGAGPRVTFRDSQGQQGSIGFSFAFAGRFVVIAEPGVGAHVYDADTGTLLRTIGVDGFQLLLSSQVMATDGETVALGAPSAGQVYLYDAATGTLLRTLDVPLAGQYTLAMEDGYVLVGAPSFEDDTSRVYLYDATSPTPRATLIPPATSFRPFGEMVRFAQGRVLCVADSTGGGADTLFVYERDGAGTLLDVARAPGIGFDGHPSGFAVVGDDLVFSVGGNDLPDEGPITAGRVEMRSIHTGDVRWHRGGFRFAFGIAIGAAGDDTVLVASVPEVGPGRVLQLERRTGRFLRTIGSPNGPDYGFGYGIVADATRALIGGTDQSGFVVRLYDLSPCGKAGCADRLQAVQDGSTPARIPRVRVTCPPVPSGGTCTAVGLADEDDIVLTNRVTRSVGAGPTTLALSLNRRGRLLFTQAGRFTLRVAVTIRSRDGKAASHVRSIEMSD